MLNQPLFNFLDGMLMVCLTKDLLFPRLGTDRPDSVSPYGSSTLCTLASSCLVMTVSWVARRRDRNARNRETSENGRSPIDSLRCTLLYTRHRCTVPLYLTSCGLLTLSQRQHLVFAYISYP